METIAKCQIYYSGGFKLTKGSKYIRIKKVNFNARYQLLHSGKMILKALVETY